MIPAVGGSVGKFAPTESLPPLAGAFLPSPRETPPTVAKSPSKADKLIASLEQKGKHASPEKNHKVKKGKKQT